MWNRFGNVVVWRRVQSGRYVQWSYILNNSLLTAAVSVDVCCYKTLKIQNLTMNWVRIVFLSAGWTLFLAAVMISSPNVGMALSKLSSSDLIRAALSTPASAVDRYLDNVEPWRIVLATAGGTLLLVTIYQSTQQREPLISSVQKYFYKLARKAPVYIPHFYENILSVWKLYYFWVDFWKNYYFWVDFIETLENIS